MNSLESRSILIVEDDAAMLRALTKVLSGEGARVSKAGWAGAALVPLPGLWEPPDLVIIDLSKPGLGGMAALGAITAAFPHVPVVVVTTLSSPELQAQCLGRGVAAFLEKPVDTRTLLEAIEHPTMAQIDRCTTRMPGSTL